MQRHDLEILVFGIEDITVLRVGFVCLVALCLLATSRTAKPFPRRWLSLMLGITMVLAFCIPWAITTYTGTRLTDADNLFFLTGEEVGPSSKVLYDAYHRWNDYHLMIITGSFLTFPLTLIVMAQSAALMILGLYRTARPRDR